MRYLAIIAFTILVGCAGSVETRATNTLAITCDTYSELLGQLVGIKESLTASQIELVDATNQRVDVACSSDSVIDPAEAIGIARSGINIVKGMLP
jgi:hypothetical protein